MSDKPIKFKSSKPIVKTEENAGHPEEADKMAADRIAAAVAEKVFAKPMATEIPNTTPISNAVEDKPAETTEDWESKIAKAKEEEEQAKANAAKDEAAALEAIQNLEAKFEPSKTEEVKEEVKAEAPKEEEKKEEKKDDDVFASYWDENVGADPVEGNATYTPSEEDIKRADSIKDNKEADASKVISCQLGSENEFIKAFDTIKAYMEKYKNLTDEDLEANPEIKKYLQWLADLNAVSETSLNTDQQKLLLGMIDAINKHNVSLKQLDRKLSMTKVSAGLQATGQPKLLRGAAAMQIINNRYRGVYKIQLHNSGFWIKSIPLRNIDVDAWMQEVDFERKQIGRLIGGHFYLGMNIYLKEKLADLLKITVVESNLEKWDEGTTLVDSISIHDYDTLCWAYSVMMHKDGVNISTVCINPDCQYHNKAQYMDLARCAYINPDVYTEEAMQFMIAGNAPGVIRTQKDIKNYKEKMLKNVRLINFSETDQYELKDPSLGEFIRTGMSTLGKLAAKVKDGKLNNDNEEVRRYAVYHLTKMMSPWISKIILNDENGKPVGVIDDRDAITNSLETSMDDEYHIIKQIEDFMTNSKVSFYTATSLKCPKCGHQPNLLKDNLFPLDVEYVLFCLSYLKLEQIGVSL